MAVLAPGASPDLSAWLSGLDQEQIHSLRHEDVGGVLACLRERVTTALLVEGQVLPLSALQVVLEAAPDLPVVLLAGVGAPTLGAAELAAGVVWACSLETPPAVAAAGLRALIDRYQRLRDAEGRLKALQSHLRRDDHQAQSARLSMRQLIHEIKTPLAAAQGYCANLLDGIAGPLGTEQHSSLERVLASCRLLQEIVERIRALQPTRPSSELGAIELRASQRRQLRVGEVAEEAVRLLEREFRLRDVRLELRLDPELRPIWGERSRLAQLLINLLDNALRHTPPGGRVEVTVGSDPGPEARGGCRLAVRDSGPGVPLEDQARIFEPGWTTASREETDRAGLGLAVCREVADEHGARLWLESKPGEGACFQLALPADPRVRARKMELLQVEDAVLAGQLLLELRERSGAPVRLLHPHDMERLATQVHREGLPVVLLGACQGSLAKALDRITALPPIEVEEGEQGLP